MKNTKLWVGVIGVFLLFASYLLPFITGNEELQEEVILEICNVIAFVMCGYAILSLIKNNEDESWMDEWNNDRRLWKDQSGNYSIWAVFHELDDENNVTLQKIDQTKAK